MDSNEQHSAKTTASSTSAKPITGSAEDGIGQELSDSIIDPSTSTIADPIADQVMDGIGKVDACSQRRSPAADEWIDLTFDNQITLAEVGDCKNFLSDPQGHLSFDQLIELNARCPLRFHTDDEVDAAAYALSKEVAEFFAQSSGVMIRQLIKAGDIDVTTKVLLHPIRSFFTGKLTKAKAQTTEETKHSIYAALELAVVSVHRYYDAFDDTSTVVTSNGMTSLDLFRPRQAIDALLLHEKKARSEKMRRIIHREYLKHRDKHASPTRHRESDPALPVPVKVRVFMNALRERNDAGAYLEWQKRDPDGVETAIRVQHKPLLVFRKEDREAVTGFFERFTGSSVDDILKILDLCIQVRADVLTGENENLHDHDHFYPARGHVLIFFLPHVKKIVEQLQVRYPGSCKGLLKR